MRLLYAGHDHARLLAFAMGQAPDEVKLAATNITASVVDDGVAAVLAGLEGILFSRDT